MTDHWITKGTEGGSHKKLDLFCQKNQINWWRIECHLTTIYSNNDPESQRKVKKHQESMEVIPRVGHWRKYYFVLSVGSNKSRRPANAAYLSNLWARLMVSESSSQQHHSFNTLESGNLWNKIKIVRIISFASQAYIRIWFPYLSTVLSILY